MEQTNISSIINAIEAAGNFDGLAAISGDNREHGLQQWIKDGQMLLAMRGKDSEKDSVVLYTQALSIDNKKMCNYNLLAVLAQRLKAGDVVLEIKEVGDSCRKKKYYDQLCKSCSEKYVL